MISETDELSNDQNLGWLLYIGDGTTHLYTLYNKNVYSLYYKKGLRSILTNHATRGFECCSIDTTPIIKPDSAAPEVSGLSFERLVASAFCLLDDQIKMVIFVERYPTISMRF